MLKRLAIATVMAGAALTQAIGIGKGSVSLADLAKADLILVVGQNPGTNHPRMLTTLEEAKQAGAHIVAINPLPEAGLLPQGDIEAEAATIARRRTPT